VVLALVIRAAGMTIKAVPILFPAGAYGTFIEWCIMYFSGRALDQLPFGNAGNSHNFSGVHVQNIQIWREFCKMQSSAPVCRLHPKTLEHESFIDNVTEVARNGPCIFLYVPTSLFALTINNKFEKVYREGWMEHNKAQYLDNLKQWHSGKLYNWELREFLSFYIWDQHLSETGADIMQNASINNVLKVNIQSIFDDFENTIRALIDYVGLQVVRTNFDTVHSEFLKRQVHYGKDLLIDSIVGNIATDWPQLTIVDESIIQMRLRNQGHDIKCFGIDTFPTTQEALRAIC
jgi:hypothetical protein